MKEKKEKKKKGKARIIIERVLVFIGITVVLILGGLIAVIKICIDGPSWVAGDLLVLSLRETSAAGFVADIFCTDEEIKKIEERNKVEQADVITDTSIIQISQNNGSIRDENGENGQNPDVKTEEEFTDGIRIEDVTGNTFKGKMMIIKDPSRVYVGSLEKYGSDVHGKTLIEFAEEQKAIAGTNAGGFNDPGGNGLGGIPDGIVISGGELKWGSLESRYEVIGFNNDNILVVGEMTGKQAVDMGIRDAVSFGPILIVNGSPVAVSGTGGGLNPRTAIGQRADGAVLLLVIDGRQASSIGASMNDITNVMLQYNAVNAANLDGGSSSLLYYNGDILNVSSSLVGMRGLPTVILVK